MNPIKKIYIFSLFLFFSYHTLGNLNPIDSLKAVLTTKISDSLKIDLHYNIAGLCVYNDIINSERHVDTALTLALKTNNSDGIGQGYAWLAYINHQKGNLSEAIDWNLKSLKIIQEQGYKSEFPRILNNLATLHLELKNYTQAEHFYKQCIEINKKNNQPKSLGSNYNNLALVYRNLKEHSKALDYYTKSSKVRSEIKDSIGLATTYSNIGTLYEDLDSLNKAQSYYKESLKIRQIKGDKKGIATSQYKIASIFVKQNNFEKAYLFAEKSLQMATKWNYRPTEKEANKVLYLINKNRQNNKQALIYFERFKELDDSINSDKNKKKIIESKYKFEYNQKHIVDSIQNEKIRLENRLLETDNQLKAKAISLQRLWLGIFFVAFISLMIILNLVRNKAKEKELLLRAEIKNRLNEIVTLQEELNKDEKKYSSPIKGVNIVLNEKLSEREQEILDLLILGMPNKEIAEQLFLSVNTIKSHINNLYVKLDVKNRTQAAVKGSILQTQLNN